MKNILLVALILSSLAGCKKDKVDPLKLKVESVETKLFGVLSEEFSLYRDTYLIRSKSAITISNLKLTGDYAQLVDKGITKTGEHEYTFMYQRLSPITAYQFDVSNESRERVTYSFVAK